ncbi:MAG: IPTL-CTERM sorting domain-containing protein [Chitinophagales bacterium]
MKHSDIYKRIYPNQTNSSKSPSNNSQQKAKNLKNKLGKYAAVSTAFIAAIPNIAYATIQHTNVTMNSVISNPTNTTGAPAIGQQNFYPIDFDGDGNNEVSINQVFFGSNSLKPFVLAQEARIDRSTFLSFSVTQLNTTQTVNSLGNLGGSNSANYLAYITPGTSYPNFATGTPKYIGVSFPIAGQTHYGWIQVTLSADAKVTTIHDFAYEDCPCQGIVVGATAGGPGLACPPANCPFYPAPNPNVPTLSEWGLLTLAVLFMTFGTLYIGRREEILEAATNNGEQFKIGYAWQKSPFEWAIFWKTFLATIGLATVAGALSLFMYGGIAAADIIGTAIAGPIFAYWMHLLWIFERNNKK